MCVSDDNAANDADPEYLLLRLEAALRRNARISLELRVVALHLPAALVPRTGKSKAKYPRDFDGGLCASERRSNVGAGVMGVGLGLSVAAGLHFVGRKLLRRVVVGAIAKERGGEI